jgi:hypothetical protein
MVGNSESNFDFETPELDYDQNITNEQNFVIEPYLAIGTHIKVCLIGKP